MSPTNGRPKKRDLIRWDEDKDAIILIAVHAHCSKQGLKLPWDDIAREVGPSVTGNAVVQHISKIKKRREKLGKIVPEINMKRKRGRKLPSNESEGSEVEGNSDDSYKITKTKRANGRTVKKSKSASATGPKHSDTIKKGSKTKTSSKSGAEHPTTSFKIESEEGSSSEKSSSSDEQVLGVGQSWMDFTKNCPSIASQDSDNGSNVSEAPESKVSSAASSEKRSKMVILPLVKHSGPKGAYNSMYVSDPNLALGYQINDLEQPQDSRANASGSPLFQTGAALQLDASGYFPYNDCYNRTDRDVNGSRMTFPPLTYEQLVEPETWQRDPFAIQTSPKLLPAATSYGMQPDFGTLSMPEQTGLSGMEYSGLPWPQNTASMQQHLFSDSGTILPEVNDVSEDHDSDDFFGLHDDIPNHMDDSLKVEPLQYFDCMNL